MELIDQSALGVRSAVMIFRKPGCSTDVLVIPMLHLAAPEFYRKVARLLRECDVVIAEGVSGWRTRVLTLSYRLAGRWRRGGLVEQANALRLRDLGPEIVCPDASEAEFAEGWRALPWGLRLLLWLLAPFFGLWMLIVGPRRGLGSRVALDDDPSAEGSELLDELLLDQRDALLVAELLRQLEVPMERERRIGVCWGAAHVPAVARALAKHGYQARETEWLLVM